MLSSIKKIILIGASCAILSFGYGCNSTVSDDYHMSNDEKWLTEQVQKGNLTQKEANDIIAKQKELKNKK